MYTWPGSADSRDECAERVRDTKFRDTVEVGRSAHHKKSCGSGQIEIPKSATWRCTQEAGAADMSAESASRIAALGSAATMSGALSARLTGRARLFLMLGSLAAVAASTIFWCREVWQTIVQHAGRFDFSQVYATARALSLDPHANIYSPSVIAASEVAGHVLGPPSLLYPYPPFLAIVLVPLAHLSFPAAADIFLYVNIGLWLLCLLIVAAEVRHILSNALVAADDTPAHSATSAWRRAWARLMADPAPLVALAICAPLFSVSRPASRTLGLGQVNFLVLLPLVAIPWLTRHRHQRLVGIAVALATMIKLTPIVLLGYLLLRRRWEAAVSAVVALAILALGCVAFVGPQVALAYPQALANINAADSTQANTESLLGPLTHLLTASHPSWSAFLRIGTYALLAALAAIVGLALWRAGPASRVSARGHDVPRAPAALADSQETAAYAAALCCIVLLSPTAWDHHYVWLLPAAALVISLALRATLIAADGAPRRRAAALFCLALVAAILLDLYLPYGWDTDPAARQVLLLGLPLRPWAQELRPLGGLLVVAVAATFLRLGWAPFAGESAETQELAAAALAQ
jgi:alpha-1,2-mannosyltransferase